MLSGDDEGAARVRGRDAHARGAAGRDGSRSSTWAGCRPRSWSGRWPAASTWMRSFPIGSGALAGRCREDPPSRARPRSDARRRRRGVRGLRCPAARSRDRRRRQRGLAADAGRPGARRRRAASARSAGSAPRPPPTSRAGTGSRPSACGCCRRAYWCSTRPPARLGHAAADRPRWAARGRRPGARREDLSASGEGTGHRRRTGRALPAGRRAGRARARGGAVRRRRGRARHARHRARARHARRLAAAARGARDLRALLPAERVQERPARRQAARRRARRPA